MTFLTALRRYRKILFSIAILSALLGNGVLIYIYLQNRPVATIVTSFTSFNDGYYEGRQQQFYSFPFNYYGESLNIRFNTRNDEGNKPVSSYSIYAIGSSGQYSKLKPNTSKDFGLLKDINSQIVVNNNFRNTISITKDNNAWHQPPGWAALNYNATKIYPAREIIFILDFREIKIKSPQKSILKSSPRFLFVNEIDPKPKEIVEQGEELIKNRFKEMQVLPDSDQLIWFQRIDNPPRGWVILIWEPA